MPRHLGTEKNMKKKLCTMNKKKFLIDWDGKMKQKTQEVKEHQFEPSASSSTSSGG